MSEMSESRDKDIKGILKLMNNFKSKYIWTTYFYDHTKFVRKYSYMARKPQDVLSIVEVQGFAFFLVHSELWG
jgi:hypothetical protein